MTQARRPLMLMILDGWGYREAKEGNAILAARTPNLDLLTEEYPLVFIRSLRGGRRSSGRSDGKL